jgi:hypothetical protein
MVPDKSWVTTVESAEVLLQNTTAELSLSPAL